MRFAGLPLGQEVLYIKDLLKNVEEDFLLPHSVEYFQIIDLVLGRISVYDRRDIQLADLVGGQLLRHLQWKKVDLEKYGVCRTSR